MAIKVVAGPTAQRERLLREARAIAALNHPNLVGVHDVGEVEGVPFLVMELVDGPTLENLPPGTIDESISAAIEVCEALSHLHERGLVHRDLKPLNVLRVRDDGSGSIKIADFGLARSGHDRGITIDGQILGTPAYISPEQARGEAIDPRTDLYALGVMLYRWTTGRTPFTADDPLVLLYQHVHAPAVPPRDIDPAFPAELEDIIVRLLAKEPQQRFESAAAVAAALRGVRNGTLAPSSRSRPSTCGTPLERGRRAFDAAEWTDAFESLARAAADGMAEAEDFGRLGTAAMWTGHYDEIVPALENAAASFSRSGDSRGAAATACQLAGLHLERRSVSLAESWLRRAEALLLELEEGQEHAHASWVRSRLYLVHGDAATARRESERTIEVARRVGDRDFEALGLIEIGHIALAEGRFEDGGTVLDEAGAMAVSGELGRLAAGTVLCGLIFAWRARGNWSRAAEWTQAQTRWCDREKVAFFPGLCRIHRGELIRMRGELVQAERDLEQGAEELIGIDSWCAAVGFRELGEVRLRRGDLRGAERAFQRAMELGSDAQPGLARLHLAEGDVDEALNGLRRALTAEAPALLDAQNRAYVLPTLVTAALAAGDRDEAERGVVELERLSKAAGSSAHRAGALVARGELLLADGDAAAAAVRLQGAWKSWCEMDAPYEAADVKSKLADALHRIGDVRGARMQLAAALAIFERLGAQLDVQRVRDRFARLDADARPALPSAEARAWAFVEVIAAERLIDALGDEAWSEFEAWLGRTLGRCCTTHGGSPAPRGLHGSFGASFAAIEQAVRCAVEMQSALQEHRAKHGFAPPVRAGIAAGPGDDAASQARELASVGGAGEIVTMLEIASGAQIAFEAHERLPNLVRLRWRERSVE